MRQMATFYSSHKDESTEESSIAVREKLIGDAVHEETLIYLVREYIKRHRFGNSHPRLYTSQKFSGRMTEGQESRSAKMHEGRGTTRPKTVRKTSDFSERAKILNKGVERINRAHIIQHAYDSKRPAWMLETLISQGFLPYSVVDELMKKGKFEGMTYRRNLYCEKAKGPDRDRLECLHSPTCHPVIQKKDTNTTESWRESSQKIDTATSTSSLHEKTPTMVLQLCTSQPKKATQTC